ncbi:MAG: hypothetical protein AB7O62_18420 [Pirellulales bacterium]
MQLVVIFVLSVRLPLAWLGSEFQSRRWLRVLLGTLSRTMCVFLASAFSLLERLSYNAWYGTASAELIDTTIGEIDGGRTEQLLPALRTLRGEFQPTYENKAHYDQLVEQFVQEVEKARTPAE